MTEVSSVIRALYHDSLTSYVQRAFAELRPEATFHIGHATRAICSKLEQVERGEIKRLLVLMPPRHLKSHSCSVVFPAWMLGRDPSVRIICMSYGLDLAESFSRDCRRLIEAPFHRTVFPRLHLDPKRASVGELRTTANGMRLATSIGGPLTGKGADILIVDDPSKAEEVASETHRDATYDWFTGTAMTRLDNPKTGALIVVAQRLHEDDLPGRLIATGEWEVLELPAIETQDRPIQITPDVIWRRPIGQALVPGHMDVEDFEAKRIEIGNRNFEAQYQQNPVPAGGNIIRPDWFETIPTGLAHSNYEAILQSWDTAAVPGESNDYSVCTTWGILGNHIDLLDVHRQQHLYPQLKSVAFDLRCKWNPNLIVIEAVGVGRSLFDDLANQRRTGVQPVNPRTGKIERMSGLSGMLEAGEVRLPTNAKWKERFLSEAAAFPNGKYDDQVDSMSQALYAICRSPRELRHCSRYKGIGQGRAFAF